MKTITEDNFRDVGYFAGSDRDIPTNTVVLHSLLCELDALNCMAQDDGHENCLLKIVYIDTDTDWSPERVDPCPNYFGMFILRNEATGETIGDPMTIDGLDDALFVISKFYESINKTK